MKINKKGQALVEFVLILPVILMIIFVVIDFSNIFYQKNHLESEAGEIKTLKQNNISDNKIKNKYKDITISYKKNANTLTIKVSKKIKLVTPFSNAFFKNPYIIETERTIFYE